MCEYIFGLSILFHCSMGLFLGQYQIDYCGFVVELEVGKRDPPCFILPSHDALAIWGLSWFHKNFRTVCYSLLKNAIGILIEIALNCRLL